MSRQSLFEDLSIVNMKDPKMSGLSRAWFQNWRATGTGDWSGGAWEKVYEAEDVQTFGALHKKTLVAVVTFRVFAEVMEVEFLGTLEAYRGRGVMGFLLPELFQGSRAEKLWLEVHEANKSGRQLYEKMGMVPGARRAEYYQDGGDAILYALEKLSD